MDTPTGLGQTDEYIWTNVSLLTSVFMTNCCIRNLQQDIFYESLKCHSLTLHLYTASVSLRPRCFRSFYLVALALNKDGCPCLLVWYIMHPLYVLAAWGFLWHHPLLTNLVSSFAERIEGKCSEHETGLCQGSASLICLLKKENKKE